MSNQSPQLEPISFSDVPGWGQDDLKGALSAFTNTANDTFTDAALFGEAAKTRGTEETRRFFEKNFTPHKVIWSEPRGLVTGYFEPVLKGSWQKTVRYNVPLYRRPPDLVSLIDDKERAKFNDKLSYMRKTPDGLEPFPTRQDIETGALNGMGLELLYLEDPIDTFFLHVQGSGRIDFDDGSWTRVTYAAKNGHPFSSIGKSLIEKGEIAKEDMCLQAIDSWLRKNVDKAALTMWQNKSFIFFEELPKQDREDGPQGAAKVPLTPVRSLAVDASIHALGTPIWVSAPALKLRDERGFNKLMIAQDVGSAIKGPERGDIYWGSGKEAGEIAGRTAHKANFFVFLPRN